MIVSPATVALQDFSCGERQVAGGVDAPHAGFDLDGRICYAASGMDKRLAALSLLGVGFVVAGSIILGVIGGRWLDTKFGSEPLWLIVGLLLGIVVAFYSVYTMLRPFFDNKRDKGNS